MLAHSPTRNELVDQALNMRPGRLGGIVPIVDLAQYEGALEEHGVRVGPQDGAGPETAPPARSVSLRQVFVGIGVAAVIVVGIFIGTGTLDEESTGLIVIEGPPGAKVWVEGQLVGETPLPEITAEVGSREVVILHPEAGEVRQTVIVDANSPAILTLGGSGNDAGDQ